LGSLVHALLAQAHGQGVTGIDALRQLAGRLADATVGADVNLATLERAASMAAGLLAHPDLAAGRGATVLFEVPYSRRLVDGRIERGTLDALIVDDTVVRVLEVKTGAARASHSAQLEAYVDAARALYPARQVEGRVIYVTEP
jgi:hypothetical protein